MGKYSSLDMYTSRTLNICAYAAAISGIFAGFLVTIGKVRGSYSSINTAVLVIFDAWILFMLCAAILIPKLIRNKGGTINKQSLSTCLKFYLAASVIHYNFITYILPSSSDQWAFALLFMILTALFLNTRMLLVNEITILLSTVIAWFIRGDALLPARNEFFTQNMALRGTFLLLCPLLLYLLISMVSKILVRDLEYTSDHDPMTHLLNRRKINQIYESRDWDRDYAIAMIDIDDFKNINDTYGHDCGDDVIRSIADRIRFNVENSDYVFRYGGDEFLVFFDTEYDKAKEIMLSIVEDTANEIYSHDKAVFHITLSAGLSKCTADTTLAEAIHDVDTLLYTSKRTGKSKLVTG